MPPKTTRLDIQIEVLAGAPLTAGDLQIDPNPAFPAHEPPQTLAASTFEPTLQARP